MKKIALIGLLYGMLVSSQAMAGVGVWAEPDSLKEGDLCPDFKMENLERKEVQLSSLRGKYVYIDVWASWCYPCRKQFPFLHELEAEIDSDEIVFLGVNIDTRDFRWLGTVKNLKLPGPQWRVQDQEFENRFGIAYIPRFILLDRDGYILRSYMDAPSKEEAKEYLTQLLIK